MINLQVPQLMPNVLDLLSSRRSIRDFKSRELTREEIETLLNHATTAPNHRLTQPWKFYVLGPEARSKYGRVLGGRKAKKIEDPEAAEQMRQKISDEHRNLPLMIAVTVCQSENPEIREEDYAAGMMAVQNIMLAAVAIGLGTHIKTGAVMDDPGARDALGIPDGERIIAVLNVGEPAVTPPPKPRRAASELTTWLP
jgi:nitroreductase